MCTSNGAPPHPKGAKVKDEVRAGANVFWEFCQKHNAVFLADPDFDRELKEFLGKHGIKRAKSTDKQKEYIAIIEKGMKESPSIV